ncbi:MAG: sugar isomerase domain-containing protein, partial [Clostridia bacterium]|nr:sugar isomerase domain-containing protein [Clostridia bacterium]
VFYKHFSYNLDIENAARPRDRSDLNIDTEGAAARYALMQSNFRPGDVLFVSSVSGRTKTVVDLAYEAVKLGINVIAFTSMEYAAQVEAVHPSGKKLYEIATLTLDNCAPAAEAMLDVDGIEARFGAASGIASDYIMWSVTSVAVEKLLEMGITPGILKSANFPGGNEYNKSVVEPHYEKYGW